MDGGCPDIIEGRSDFAGSGAGGAFHGLQSPIW